MHTLAYIRACKNDDKKTDQKISLVCHENVKNFSVISQNRSKNCQGLNFRSVPTHKEIRKC